MDIHGGTLSLLLWSITSMVSAQPFSMVSAQPFCRNDCAGFRVEYYNYGVCDDGGPGATAVVAGTAAIADHGQCCAANVVAKMDLMAGATMVGQEANTVSVILDVTATIAEREATCHHSRRRKRRQSRPLPASSRLPVLAMLSMLSCVVCAHAKSAI
jgi:hypothetical protein